MEELKTLKNITHRLVNDPEKNLKEVAIKWVKAIRNCYTLKKDGTKSYSGEKIDKFYKKNNLSSFGNNSYQTKIQQLETMKATYIHFFNLTEEDLK